MMPLLMLCKGIAGQVVACMPSDLANYSKGSKLLSLHESLDNTSAAAANNIKAMQAREIPFGKGKSLPCVLSRPTGTARPVGVVLAHGAGGDLTSGNLPRIAQRLASAGYFCIRFTCKPTRLPYRVKACQAVLDDAAAQPETSSISSWVFAGHSMGARVASDMAHQNTNADAAILGCIFFSYPLHTAGNEEALRDKPLVDLTCPVLFVRGSKDPMSKQDIFTSTLERMSATQVQVHTVEGGNHSLSVPGGKEKVETALEAALTAVCDFLDGLKLASQTQSDNPHSHNTKEGRAILTAAEDNKTGPVSGRKKRAKLA